MKLDVEGTNSAQRPRLGGGIIKTITEISELRPPFISLGQIASEVSSALHLPTDLLHSLSRNRQGALARAVTGYVGRKLGGYQIKAIAAHFHRVPVVIRQGIKRLENKLKEEKGFVKTLIGIEQSLIRKSSRKILI